MAATTDEYKALVDIASQTGSERNAFGAADTAYVVVHANQVLGQGEVPGLTIEARETEDGIEAYIDVADGAQIEKQVHLCFGHLGKDGRQVITSHIRIGRNASAGFLSHCIFPNAVKLVHEMEGDITLAEGARFAYNEVHVHGKEGEIEVRPKTRVTLGDGALYSGDFSLVEGRVGDLEIDMDVDAFGAKSRVELTSKVYGKKDDSCLVRDVIQLRGPGSSALIKARTVLRDESSGKFLGMIDGAAPGARGHVDCTEVVQGQAQAEASPVVKVTHPEAEVTHEAAIGRIADDKIEGLMAKGLDEEEAVDVIVSGLLR
ncbi:MAG: SufD family Fe-S cluster assembly protein [Synergistales bacterium]|nr:SufD family Fe-S cluster assembly protein [Synergistales bacterium]